MGTFKESIKTPKKNNPNRIIGNVETLNENFELKYQKLLNENEELDKQISEFIAKGITTDLNPQMKALHDYNEMKDLTQVVLGYLANIENVSLTELHERYNLPTE